MLWAEYIYIYIYSCKGIPAHWRHPSTSNPHRQLFWFANVPCHHLSRIVSLCSVNRGIGWSKALPESSCPFFVRESKRLCLVPPAAAEGVTLSKHRSEAGAIQTQHQSLPCLADLNKLTGSSLRTSGMIQFKYSN